MGCSNSKPIVPNQVEITDDGSVHWKILPSFEEAMQKYIQDGTLTKHSKPAELEFRTLLDEPLAMVVKILFLFWVMYLFRSDENVEHTRKICEGTTVASHSILLG